MERLGLRDEELCTILDADPIAVITGELAHRPELGILLGLSRRRSASASAPTSCAAGSAPPVPPAARSTTCSPRDFPAFESAIETSPSAGSSSAASSEQLVLSAEDLGDRVVGEDAADRVRQQLRAARARGRCPGRRGAAGSCR